MTNSFDVAVPRRVLFGCGRLREAGAVTAGWGSRALVFTGSDSRRADALAAYLPGAGITLRTTRGEPTFDGVREHLAAARSMAPDVVIAMGGGSVIDTAKAVAMLLANGGDPLDYAEVIGRGHPVTRPSLPWLAIPTTAGAGAEATRNAVLKSEDDGVKVSLRSPLMLPDAVIIDPETTIGLSPAITAATGMDALSQLIEPFVSIRANPFTDALCRAGIPRIARALERACMNAGDLDAREDMSLAAWWSGMALANAGLGAVHGFAAALGGLTDAPHGLICARFLAPVCRANIAALGKRDEAHPSLAKYREMAFLLTGHAEATPEDGVDWLEQLAIRLPLGVLPPVARDEVDGIIHAAHKSSSMKGNPLALTVGQLEEIARAVMAP